MMRGNLNLGAAVAMWPTADASQHRMCGTENQDGLSKITQLWTTPRVSMANGPGIHGQGGPDPQTQTTNWPTPDANCHKGSTQPGQRVGQLDEAAEVLWITLAEGSGSSLQVRGWVATALSMRSESFCEQTMTRLGDALKQSVETQRNGSESSPSRRRLNPQFVTWLMGWPPLGESGFAFSETEWCHYRQRQQSSLSGMRWKEIGDDDASLFA
jgi:hypothetical protein